MSKYAVNYYVTKENTSKYYEIYLYIILDVNFNTIALIEINFPNLYIYILLLLLYCLI